MVPGEDCHFLPTTLRTSVFVSLYTKLEGSTDGPMIFLFKKIIYISCVYVCTWCVCMCVRDRETERVGVHMPQPIGKRRTTTLWRHFRLPTVTWLLGIEFTYSSWATLLGLSVIFLTSWPKKMTSTCVFCQFYGFIIIWDSLCFCPCSHVLLLSATYELFGNNAFWRAQTGSGYLGNVWIHQAWHHLSFCDSDWLRQAAFNGG